MTAAGFAAARAALIAHYDWFIHQSSCSKFPSIQATGLERRRDAAPPELLVEMLGDEACQCRLSSSARSGPAAGRHRRAALLPFGRARCRHANATGAGLVVQLVSLEFGRAAEKRAAGEGERRHIRGVCAALGFGALVRSDTSAGAAGVPEERPELAETEMAQARRGDQS
jgi:hypothetical protein